jgi:lipid II:glycine glycyltransferase (peptidoglycan interpeptide bridge formation enzyme)
LTFHPSVVDIRPFLWVNYGSDLPQYVPDVRYTSYVDLTGFESAGSYENAEIFRRASPSRRQEIRYAANEQITTAEAFDPETFLEYYRLTMARQSITVASNDLDKMRRIMGNLQDRGMGRMFASYSRSGAPGSFAFFGIDSKRGYYLFGANHPDTRDQHCGTQVLWQAFQALCRDGVRTVDLEGVNSPYRGWFKLSFGGNLIPYYSVCYSAVNAGQTGASTVKEAALQ